MGNIFKCYPEGADLPGPPSPSPAPSTSLRSFLTTILPQASRELQRWKRQLDHCSDWTLLRQASLSLQSKRFHSQGGVYYALYNTSCSKYLVPLIVALQTISDYLDNLCDRSSIYQEPAFRNLHLSMRDALSPEPCLSRDYYRFYPSRDDGGYLQALVGECRRGLAQLPSYEAVRWEALRLISLYNDLQVYKHLTPEVRGYRLKKWFREKASPVTPAVYWWEFAAACGSTLAVFALLAAASSHRLSKDDALKISTAYFPWVCGLHILLDYFIDQAEDEWANDFNFVACYQTPEQAEQRLHLFLRQSMHKVSSLPHPDFHRSVIRGLLAVYLSDPKIKSQGLQNTAGRLINSAGLETKLLHRLCLILRKIGVL